MLDEKKSNRELIRVDIPKDGAIAGIFLLPYIAMIILSPLNSYYPIYDISIYIAFYLSYLALILQDRTTIEVTQNKIKINRVFFGPLIISKKDVSLTEIKENIFHSLRFPVYIFMLILLLFNINNAYHGIHNAMLRSYPTEQLFFRFLSRTLIIILLCVLFYLMERRLRIPNVLEISTHSKKYKLYTPNPDAFEKLIDINVRRSKNDSGN